MSSYSLVIPVFIILHFSSCLATSDPNLYGNKTQQEDDDSQEKIGPLGLINLVRGPNQKHGVYLTAEDFQNALHIDVNDDTSPNWVTRHATDMFEGDISGVQSIQELRNAIIGLKYRWPNAVIPYVISAPFTSAERSIIARAMMEYHNKTCIRFVPRTIQPDYLVIKTTGSGCNSNVGRTGGPQTVSLDQGCVHVGLIIHELMHASGFFHEQARTDRDDYVVINWGNIQDGMQRNFDKLGLNEIEYLGTRYDTGSVMHYDQLAFAKDRKIPTIYSKTGSKLGNTRGFSQNDILKLNRMYHCGSEEVTTTAPMTIPTTQSTTTTTTTIPTIPTTQSTTTAPLTTPQATTTQGTAGTIWTTITTETDDNTGTTALPPIDTTTSQLPMVTTGPECADAMTGCDMWSNNGFCTKSVQLMTTFCRKTCGFCGGTYVKPCIDSFTVCAQWANMGQCNQDFMVANCPSSCNACKNP